MLMRLVLTLVVAVPLLFAQTSQVRACSCGGTASPSEEMRVSGSVFHGIARSIDDDDSSRENRVEFAVLTVWKGEIAEEITVFTSDTSDDCGYKFHEGVEYIVYASRETSWVGICGRTASISAAGADLEELGPGTTIDYGGKPPVAYDPADQTPLENQIWLIPVIAALIAGVVGLVWLKMNHLGPRLR